MFVNGAWIGYRNVLTTSTKASLGGFGLRSFALIERAPQAPQITYSAAMVRWVSGGEEGSQLRPHDAEKRQSLGRLYTW